MNTPLFKRFNLSAILAAIALASFTAGAQVATPATNAVTGVDPAAPRTNTAIVPRLNPGFMPRHTNFVEIAKKGDIDILFMGDSITDWWRSAAPRGGRDAFAKYFADLKIANFGIAGDTTQGVLWRLQNGEAEGYTPRAVMLMIGTNNTGGRGGGNTGNEIAEGVEAIVAEFRKRFPRAKILLLAIFPRATPGSPVRAKIAEINQRIAKLHNGDSIVYMDIGAKFLDADGNFLPDVFWPDNLHPSGKGYEIWGEAVKDTLVKLANSSK